MHKGYLAFLLHAHLPYVRHPEEERFLEESWLFETISETYIPLLQVFKRLHDRDIPFRLTLSLSPTLITMLQDELLQHRYQQHLQRVIGLAEQELRRKHADERTQRLAEYYLHLYRDIRQVYLEEYQQDLIGAFDRLHRAGGLDLISSAATHGFLPLLRTEPGSVRAQLEVAANVFERSFSRPLQGIWLPECGYYPGLEQLLQPLGIRYFIVDTHGLLNASSKPWHGTAAPMVCPNGTAAFGRDADSSKQVWSAKDGYPGDSWYREFHRDLGFERPQEELESFLTGDGMRTHTGIKYFRVTNKGRYKQPYEPARAKERTQVHAEDFLAKRLEAIKTHSHMDRPPVFLAPYDAELFGHWWFEGPLWLEALIEKIACQKSLELITPFDYLQRHPTLQAAQPSASSWGEHGYNAYWLNEQNDWIYPHLHRAAKSMQQMAVDYADEPPASLRYRALQQAGRSLLLAQASDWPFIIKSGANASYAEKRIRELLSRFGYLEQAIRNNEVDPRKLQAMEQMDAIFPDLDIGCFNSQE
jgi:1,4-alpha-glucan branching enzyme